MEFKKLSAVEAVESVSDAAHVLIEENGIIKRAPKDEVGGGVKKELVYEWNFSANDEVYEIAENVDEDLSWMLDKNINIGFEVEAAFYGNEEQEITNDDGSTSMEGVINTDIEAILTITDSQYNIIRLKSDRDYLLFGLNECGGWMPSHVTLNNPCFELYIIDKKHIDEDWIYTEVSKGGAFEMYAGGYWPFKSIKVYKITH